MTASITPHAPESSLGGGDLELASARISQEPHNDQEPLSVEDQRLIDAAWELFKPARPRDLVYGIIDPDYARVFTVARCIAWSEGYALAMHGSFTRDLDLIAVPWDDAAADAEHLVRRIALALDDLSILVKKPDATSQASQKPHGRLAWTLTFKTFGDPRFVDLSVMPRSTSKPLENDPAELADANSNKGQP